MLAVLSLLLPMLVCAPEGVAATGSGADRRASHIYHLTKFIEWPDAVFDDAAAPLRICTYGTPASAPIEALSGRAAQGRTIEIRVVPAKGSLDGCQLVVFDDASSSPAAVAGPGVLTVGPDAAFAERGGMIGFVERDGGIGFAVNPGAAEKAGLKVSSRLLRLADIVDGGEAHAP